MRYLPVSQSNGFAGSRLDAYRAGMIMAAFMADLRVRAMRYYSHFRDFTQGGLVIYSAHGRRTERLLLGKDDRRRGRRSSTSVPRNSRITKSRDRARHHRRQYSGGV